MSFTTLLTKTTANAISVAEMQALFDNVEWWRTRPAIRIYRSDTNNSAVATSTDATLEFNSTSLSGSQWHEEWMSPDTAAATYLQNAGFYPSGDSNPGSIYAGDVEAGIWLCGASGAFEPNGTGTRRIRLRRDGTVDVLHQEESFNAPTNRRVSFHQCTLIDLNSSEDQFKCQVWQDSGGSLDIAVNFQPPRFWGLWLAQNASYSATYAAARPDSNTGPATFWTNIRSNQYRIQRRPSASMYRSSSQSISAGVQTKVVFNAEEHDTDGGQNDTTLGHITVAESGWHLIDWGVKCVSLSGGTNTLGATVYRDSTAIDSQAKPIPDTATLATSGQIMSLLTAGQEISVEVSLAVACTVGGDRGTYLRIHNLSSNSGVSPGRQEFGPIPPASEIPTIADLSSPYIGLNTMRLASDLTDRMWHRPVIRLQASEVGSVAVLSNDDGWVDIPVDNLLTDYTDLEGKGYTVTGGGGFRAPFAGTWLCNARLLFSGQDEDGSNVGDIGYRGARMVRNGGAGTGAVITKSAKIAGTGWLQQWCEPFVLNEGDTVSIQALTGSMAGDPGVTVADAQLFVAEIGDGITRDAA